MWLSRAIILLSLMFLNMCVSEQKDSVAVQGRQIEYRGTLEFLNDTTVISKIDIAVADDEMSRSLGLMDVRDLKHDGGMLFVFNDNDRLSFWMANTPLPLDLIFVNSNLQIVHIHHNATPFSQQGIDSVYPAKYVVEVNAGYAMRYDLQPGQFISFNYK